MEKSSKTRNLTRDEVRRVVTDLAIRGWLSLFGAAMVVVFAAMLTIHGVPLFRSDEVLPLCVGAIWVAVFAVDFGMVRTGLQLLAWRKARHTGAIITEDQRPKGLIEDIFNFIGMLIFIAFGIAVLATGELFADGLRTMTQLPISLLSISFGLNSAETIAMHIWMRKAKLADVSHELISAKSDEK